MGRECLRDKGCTRSGPQRTVRGVTMCDAGGRGPAVLPGTCPPGGGRPGGCGRLPPPGRAAPPGPPATRPLLGPGGSSRWCRPHRLGQLGGRRPRPHPLRRPGPAHLRHAPRRPRLALRPHPPAPPLATRHRAAPFPQARRSRRPEPLLTHRRPSPPSGPTPPRLPQAWSGQERPAPWRTPPRGTAPRRPAGAAGCVGPAPGSPHRAATARLPHTARPVRTGCPDRPGERAWARCVAARAAPCWRRRAWRWSARCWGAAPASPQPSRPSGGIGHSA